MKKRLMKRIIAMFLALCTILTGVSLPENVFAAQKSKEELKHYQEVESKEESWMSEDSPIFKHLDKETFKKGKHTSRIKNEEKLNTYVFGNADGSKTIYYMYENV